MLCPRSHSLHLELNLFNMASSQTPFIPSYDTCEQVSLTCPVEATLYGYAPNYGASIFFTVLFGLALVFQIMYGIYTKTWSFMTGICIGVILETAGYTGRIAMHHDPWNRNAMQLQLVCLILAPSAIAAAISVTFKHLIIYVGEQHSKLMAKWYPWVFIGTDFISIIIQAIGGIVSLLGAGNGLIIAGVSFQVANMVLCVLTLSIFHPGRYPRISQSRARRSKDPS